MVVARAARRASGARLGLQFAVLALAAGCQATPPFTKDPRPWEKGSPVTAPELETLLKPLEPAKWTGLRKGTDGRYYYLAELESSPSGDFIERQHQAYQSRGVFTRAIGESPHSFPRRLGYEHVILRKGRVKPWSLHCLEIDDSNPKWISEAPFYRQFPKPSHLEGRLFVFRLGQSDVTAWKELVIVPDQDLMTLKELPFLRFPGAVINAVVGEKENPGPGIAHRYVVRTHPINEVLEHYRKVIVRAGFPIDYDNIHPRELTWRADGQAVNGVISIGVMETVVPFLLGKPFGLAEVRERVPFLFEDFPDPVTGFQVSMDFEDASLAAPYQPEKDSY
jgi:hypothetical protein